MMHDTRCTMHDVSCMTHDGTPLVEVKQSIWLGRGQKNRNVLVKKRVEIFNVTRCLESELAPNTVRAKSRLRDVMYHTDMILNFMPFKLYILLHFL